MQTKLPTLWLLPTDDDLKPCSKQLIAQRPDDFRFALREVLVTEAGGKARFPVRPWQGKHFVYVEDPDGHVIELLDATVEECAAMVDGGLPDHTAEAV